MTVMFYNNLTVLPFWQNKPLVIMPDTCIMI